VCMSVHDVHISVILERYSRKTCEPTKQMLSLLAKTKTNTTRMRLSHNLVSVTHKVSGHHLHEEWQ
jgi:hypothetical protein